MENKTMEQRELEYDTVKEEIKEHWDRIQEHAFFEDDEEEAAWRISLNEEFGDAKLKILDVGTGNGSLALLLSEMGHDVIGTDISEGMLSVARKKAQERGVNPDLRIGDAESLDFEDNSFDAVVSRVVLWTLPHPNKAISEWKRVLNPSGKVYTFEIESFGKSKGINASIKRNLGLLLISAAERKNAWKNARYSNKISKNLPICYEKASSSAVNKVELFRKGGFDDVSVYKMENVSEITLNNRKKESLGYRLVGGDYGDYIWYFIRGCKPQ